MLPRWQSHHWISHTRKAHATRKPHSMLPVIEPELWAIEVNSKDIGIFDFFCSCDLDLDPMTFIYELDAYSLEIHRMCKYELPTPRLSKVIVIQTCRHTDKLRVVTFGHVTKMAVTPFDPPYSKTPC